MAELKPYRGNYYLWLYIPSTAAAGLFTALFALATVCTIWRMFKTRTWFCIPFVVGGLLEVVGYAERATARDKTDKLMPYVIQSTFLLVAPALFAASAYMVLGRTIRSLHAESLSIVPVKWLTKLFVCGDVVSFIVQASGAGIMVTANSMSLGEDIILGGLFVQIIMFGLFAVTSAIFHRRMSRHQASNSRDTDWKKTMVMLYLVSAFIMMRSIYRVVEYIMGHNGYLLSNEWPLYVFDGSLMFGVMVVFVWRYPDQLNNRKTEDDIELSCESQFMEEGTAGPQKRPIL